MQNAQQGVAIQPAPANARIHETTAGEAAATGYAEPRMTLVQATLLHEGGRLDEAKRAYETLLADQPDDAEALHLYGVLHAQQGQPERALTLLRRSTQLMPQPLALANLGSILAAGGQIDEALACFDAALKLDPRDLHALVRRGNTLIEAGRYEEAVAAYDQTLAVAPMTLDALCNRGSALRVLGRYQEALDTYAAALTVDPRSFESHANRGNVLKLQGRHAEALGAYDRALEIAPNHPAILNMRGMLLIDMGRAREALASFNEAIAGQPDLIDALYNSAVALEHLGHVQEVVARCDRVLALQAQHARALATRANARLALKDYKSALTDYDAALLLDPQSTSMRCNRSTALRHLGRYDEALTNLDQVLAIEPSFAAAWGNRGNVLQDLQRFDEALAANERMLEIDPRSTIAWLNRGNVLLNVAKPGEALEAYERALALEPEHFDAHGARAFVYLRQGDFERGWSEYEWRWRDPASKDARHDLTAPRWSGAEDLNGKTILLHAEQGFGDTLQFCRFVEPIVARGAKVLLEVQPALRLLMPSLRGPSQIFSKGEPLPPYDFHCPLLSVPLALGTDLTTLPAHTPYLAADPKMVEKWRQLLGDDRRMRVGVVWSGNPQHLNDRNRSIRLASLAPLVKSAPDVDWISLQKLVRDEDKADLATLPLSNLANEIRDFSDTAALVSALDLVIAVDTGVAHLAGALGRPVWLLLSEPSDWRWLSDRTDSPWYPTARLFRQGKPGDWASAIESVKNALREATSRTIDDTASLRHGR
ncbi:Beta-barrel assembly-enhancing protease [Paraburkholderia sediminicola]|uniref:Beta-barrel assembly-enhancing protease n=1 Tax=Paraburkholderia sediminicola TaxID=458836 RepID=A0A6J5A2M7_9BURK|nr:tetratricopeptide repeat protein [Paraburkholderia sediminicola]CAB3643720.1 Beta-barrel assembly-enhancing protease [Paraburkholderia sediminicola]